MPGYFIVLEGIDTDILFELAEDLKDWMQRKDGVSVLITNEPTDGPLGAQLRLISNGRISMHEYAKALLFVADRMDHYFGTGEEHGILADIQRGRMCISIRYLLSAYADYSDIASIEWLMKINSLFPWPDLMIFIDTPQEDVLRRFVMEYGFDDAQLKAKSDELNSLRAKYFQIIELLREKGRRIEIIRSVGVTKIKRDCAELVKQYFD